MKTFWLVAMSLIIGLGAVNYVVSKKQPVCINCDCGCQEGKPCDCCK